MEETEHKKMSGEEFSEKRPKMIRFKGTEQTVFVGKREMRDETQIFKIEMKTGRGGAMVFRDGEELFSVTSFSFGGCLLENVVEAALKKYVSIKRKRARLRFRKRQRKQSEGVAE